MLPPSEAQLVTKARWLNRRAAAERRGTCNACAKDGYGHRVI